MKFADEADFANESEGDFLYRLTLHRCWRVYRCWSAVGDLLYIGQTTNWDLRLSVHKCRTPWWNDVADVTFSARLSRDDALAVEAACIRWEAPRYNIRHNVKRVMLPLSHSRPRTATLGTEHARRAS